MALKSPTRRRLYETGAAILGVMVVWGALTAEEAAQLVELMDKALGAALLMYARTKTVDLDH